MGYIIRCECGVDVTGPTEDDVIAQGVEHARDGHAMNVTPEQVRPLVEMVGD